jgi:hypothetical protein
MSCCRSDSTYAVAIDEIDSQIAYLVDARNRLVATMPTGYDCCGEGEVYFKKLSGPQAEDVYHSVARINRKGA